jgi:hypothetical protein
MSDTDAELVNNAVNGLLKRDPRLAEGATSHVARVLATPVTEPAKMTPEQVRAEIERLSGRAPLTENEIRDIDRDSELARKQAEYEKELAKRQQDETAARMREIFRSVAPAPETT